MKTLMLLNLLFFNINLFSQTITAFRSQGEVLSFLESRTNFSNSDLGITITFSDMGSRLKTNSGLDYFNPSVVLLSSTRAKVTYESLTTNGFIKIIVDCRENVIIDQNSNTVFSSISNNGSLSTNTANSDIIGNPIKIGNLLVAQFDFPDQMDLNDAKSACAELGNGWRLPTKDELNTLYQNQDLIGGFTEGGYARDYWSSTEGGNFGGAWHQYLSNGRQYIGFADNVLNVRAVKTLETINEPVKKYIGSPSKKPVVVNKAKSVIKQNNATKPATKKSN